MNKKFVTKRKKKFYLMDLLKEKKNNSTKNL